MGEEIAETWLRDFRLNISYWKSDRQTPTGIYSFFSFKLPLVSKYFLLLVFFFVETDD